jgi:hypothetical protein
MKPLLALPAAMIAQPGFCAAAVKPQTSKAAIKAENAAYAPGAALEPPKGAPATSLSTP